jgi:hypothetical protein
MAVENRLVEPEGLAARSRLLDSLPDFREKKIGREVESSGSLTTVQD